MVYSHILILGTVAVMLLAVLVNVAHLRGLIVAFGTLKKMVNLIKGAVHQLRKEVRW
jgi:hypothetical protein